MTRPEWTPEQAQALGSATRQEILRFLRAADHPVAVADLAKHLGINHTAVRKHLEQLLQVDFVVETQEVRTTRGRPRLLYALAPPSPLASEGAYERLSVLLATALRKRTDVAEVGRRAGREAPAPIDADPVAALAARLTAEGFEPTVRRRGARSDLVLGRCPFAAAVEANPAAICRLHLGLAEGAAETIGGIEVEGLLPRDPYRAGCRLTVTEKSP